MKLSKLQGSNGLWFVNGSGFSGKSEASATALTAENIACLAGVGFTGTTHAVPDVSYAVVYIRKGDAVTATSIKKQSANSGLNQFDPSKRRFATRQEANTHGKRFDTRRANRTDAVGSGTAGHIGFYVIETKDPVNSSVNPATGLTNSLK